MSKISRPMGRLVRAAAPNLLDHSLLTAADLAHALGGRQMPGGYFMACCPAHEDHTASLSIIDGNNGRPVLHCFAGCTFVEVRNALAVRGLWPDGPARLERQEVERRLLERAARDDAARKAKEAEALAIRQAARSIEPDDLAARYLGSRGSPPPYPPSLRQGTYRSSKGRNWAVLVAAACRYPGDSVAAVQVTPLKEPGAKAWSEPQRLTIGRPKGAVVRVSPYREGQPIVLTEGVEDALAVAAACPDVAAWAVLGTDNAPTVQLPHQASVVLCLDGDEAGRKATAVAAETLQQRGHDVLVAPLPDGMDPASFFVQEPA